MKILISMALIAGGLMGCSNQWRETDPGVSPAQVQSMLSEVSSSAAATGGGGISQAMAIKDDPATAIYFAEAENTGGDSISPMGTVQSIISLYNFSFLGLNDLTRDQIQGTRIFFLVQKLGDGSFNCGLIIGIKRAGGDGNFSYYGLSGVGSINDGEFAVKMTGDSGEAIQVTSFDVDEGDLLETIQLKVWDSMGNYNGKFSTLFGSSQQ